MPSVKNTHQILSSLDYFIWISNFSIAARNLVPPPLSLGSGPTSLGLHFTLKYLAFVSNKIIVTRLLESI